MTMRKLIPLILAAAFTAPGQASAATTSPAPCTQGLVQCVEDVCEAAMSNCPVSDVQRICTMLVSDCSAIYDVQQYCRQLIDSCPLVSSTATRSGTSVPTCQAGETYAACAVRIVRESTTCAGSCVPGCGGEVLLSCAEKAIDERSPCWPEEPYVDCIRRLIRVS